MLWSKFIVALAFVPSMLATPIAFRKRNENELSSRSELQKRGAGSSSYTVVGGDTGNAIAAVYSITFSTLSSANPNVNWNNLQVGQVLSMPSSRTPVTYSTLRGDTQTSIAQKYNVYTTDLANANPSINWSSLPLGTKVRVPGYGAYTTYSVVGGDYGNAIAGAFGITFNTLSAANPGVAWNNLQVGQVLTIPAGTSPTQGTLPSPAVPPKQSTTTTKAATTSTTLSNLNPITPTTTTKSSTTTAFVLNPSTTKSSTTTMSVTPTSPTTNPFVLNPSTSRRSGPTTTTTTTTTKPVTTSSTTTKTTAGTGEPSVTPTATVTGANYVTGGNNNDGVASRADSYNFYQGDGSPSAGWPAKSQWISFSTMWNNLAPYLGQSCQSIFGVANNSPQENQYLYNAIQAIAANSGVDHRLILATIIQESSACVRVKTTISPDQTVTNPGLMQTYNGQGSCNRNGVIQNPCPASQIYQMISDGTFGTSTDGGKTYHGGLVQDINSSPSYSGSQVIYRASRIYNSGSIPSSNDLGAPGATRCYVSDIANRLMGWIGATRTCTLS